ncbi:cupin domain-containing protein [Candidatus Sumerlaeota bacterium]|nr:cupin domain-containing protein [Candidatus Sumerlaeota bacterium]
MTDEQERTGPKFVLIEKKHAAADPRLAEADNSGRKVFAKQIREGKSYRIPHPQWLPPARGKPSWIYETADIGIEIATFNERTSQERHAHDEAFEIYEVLDGEMLMEIGDRTIALQQGDEVVLLPGTSHIVLREGSYLARVHTFNCGGERDKRRG